MEECSSKKTGKYAWHRRHVVVTHALLLVLALGCSIAGPTAVPAWAQATMHSLYGVKADVILAAARYRIEPGLSARERFLKAVYLLGDGRVGPARAELEAALLEEPESPDALLLILQIDQDPVSLMGSNSLSYSLKPDESLFRVADRFLKSKYLFYALARYNGVRKPNDIREGQRIRIPQTTIHEIQSRRNVQASLRRLKQSMLEKKLATSVATLEKDLKAFPDDPHLTQYGAQVYFDYGKLMHGKGDFKKAAQFLRSAKRLGNRSQEIDGLLRKAESRLVVQRLSLKVQNLLKQGQFDAAIESLEKATVRYPGNAKLKSLLVKSYIEKSDVLSKKEGQEDASLNLLVQAQKLDKKNPRVAAKLKKLKGRLMENRQELLAEKFFAEGNHYLQTSAHLQAFWAFKRAAQRNPKHQEAKRKITELGPMLSKDMHEKATAAFYQEEEDVDQAICLWDQVLKIDPENRLVRAERDRADLADCNVKKLFQEEGLCGRRDCSSWVPADLLADNAAVSDSMP